MNERDVDKIVSQLIQFLINSGRSYEEYGKPKSLLGFVRFIKFFFVIFLFFHF